MLDKSAWALGLDYGCEGQRPPIVLFRSREEAFSAAALMEKCHGPQIYLLEVPYWPRLREDDDARKT